MTEQQYIEVLADLIRMATREDQLSDEQMVGYRLAQQECAKMLEVIARGEFTTIDILTYRLDKGKSNEN
jgi:hypothetical protein